MRTKFVQRRFFAVCCILILWGTLTLWNFRSVMVFHFRNTFYSKSTMIERYFDVDVVDSVEILEYSIVKNEREAPGFIYIISPIPTPYIFSAKLRVREDLVEKVIKRSLASIARVDKEGKPYYAYYGYKGAKIGFARTIPQKSFSVSEPENGYVYIRLHGSYIGWE